MMNTDLNIVNMKQCYLSPKTIANVAGRSKIPLRYVTVHKVEDYDGDESECDSVLSDEEEFIDHEEEEKIVQAMVLAAFSRSISDHDLKRFLQVDESSPDGPDQKKVCRPSSLDEEESIILSLHDMKPDDYLRKIVSTNFKLFPAKSLSHFFTDITDKSVSGYDRKLFTALRGEDITSLRVMMKEGHPMQCGNKFGETVVHLACRRNSDVVLNFLMDEAKVSIRVICDSGRTPLHDACWTSKPNWEIITKLLDECPDLLYITDNRGFTPLAYVPHAQWMTWCSYLERRGASSLQRKQLD
jgi:Ankyrin repeats (3 copies)